MSKPTELNNCGCDERFNNIKPCLFCGESQQLQVIKVDAKNMDRDLIKCRKCYGQAPRGVWNTANPKAKLDLDEDEVIKEVEGLRKWDNSNRSENDKYEDLKYGIGQLIMKLRKRKDRKVSHD